MPEFRRKSGTESGAPLTVSALTAALGRTIEGRFGHVVVEGEILSCRRASSGHVYFTLKDPGAQLPAVMWRDAAARLPIQLRDGMKVVVIGKIQVYAPHGKYQLIARTVRESGLGELLLRLHALRKRLTDEGLFDEARKRPLPVIPRAVGVVTAITGAAIRDIVETIQSRYPTRIVIASCHVQGPRAVPSIVRALAQLDRHPDVEVIICGRGGGSMEDLWAFNEEAVVRAIAACETPVVSAVGHESDVLLSDAVADRRAATPTAAAEMVVPRWHDIEAWLGGTLGRLARAMRARLVRAEGRYERQARALPDPRRWVGDRQQQLDELSGRLTHAMSNVLFARTRTQLAVVGRLRSLHPNLRLARAQQRLDEVSGPPARQALP